MTVRKVIVEVAEYECDTCGRKTKFPNAWFMFQGRDICSNCYEQLKLNFDSVRESRPKNKRGRPRSKT